MDPSGRLHLDGRIERRFHQIDARRRRQRDADVACARCNDEDAGPWFGGGASARDACARGVEPALELADRLVALHRRRRARKFKRHEAVVTQRAHDSRVRVGVRGEYDGVHPGLGCAERAQVVCACEKERAWHSRGELKKYARARRLSHLGAQ